MKPANFPERINQRRKGALERIPSSAYAGRAVEIAALHARIKDSARDVRTKKHRSGTR